jgi:hypothetical protein
VSSPVLIRLMMGEDSAHAGLRSYPNQQCSAGQAAPLAESRRVELPSVTSPCQFSRLVGHHCPVLSLVPLGLRPSYPGDRAEGHGRLGRRERPSSTPGRALDPFQSPHGSTGGFDFRCPGCCGRAGPRSPAGLHPYRLSRAAPRPAGPLPCAPSAGIEPALPAVGERRSVP